MAVHPDHAFRRTIGLVMTVGITLPDRVDPGQGQLIVVSVETTTSAMVVDQMRVKVIRHGAPDTTRKATGMCVMAMMGQPGFA